MGGVNMMGGVDLTEDVMGALRLIGGLTDEEIQYHADSIINAH
jgi:hypothetical protein